MPASAQGMSIQLIGDVAGVQKMFEHLDSALNPIAIAAFLGAEITPYLQARAKARFSGEGDDVVGGWRPLSAVTENFRATGRAQGMWAVGDAHPINVRTHQLEQYITSGIGNVSPTPSGAILQYPNPSRVTRTLREKIKTAQQGKAQPRTPPRPVLGVNERDMTFLLLSLASHIKKHRVMP
jgi:hypothetical protein